MAAVLKKNTWKCKFGLDLIIFQLTHALMYIYIDCFTSYYDLGYNQVTKSDG